MANPELELISNVVAGGDFSLVRKRGITPEFFQTEEGATTFRWLWDQYHDQQHRGEVPDRARLMRKFPDFPWCPSRNSVAALLSELQDSRARFEMEKLSTEMSELVGSGEDPKMILAAFLPKLRALSITSDEHGGLLMRDGANLLRQEYDTMSKAGGITGIPWPWEPLNTATGGMQNEQFLLIYARPKQMKCAHHSERIMFPDGDMVSIRDIPDELSVQSYTDTTGQLRWASAEKVYCGKKPCVRVVTESGNELRSGAEHYYMVPSEDGLFEGKYRRAKNLVPGDWVATARPGTQRWAPSSRANEGDAWTLGALFGDGCFRAGTPAFTNEDAGIIQKLREYAARNGFEVRQSKNNPIQFSLGRTDRTKPTNPLTEWLQYLEVDNKLSVEKATPSYIFRGTPDMLAAFLAGLLDTDGTVHSTRGEEVVSWYTSSEQLGRDIKHLLGRLGVQSSRYFVPSRNAWQISVADAATHGVLYDLLGRHLAHVGKKERLRNLANRELTRTHAYKDVIPESRDLRDLISRAKGTKPWPKMGSSMFDRSKLFRRSGAISRAMLRKLADAWNSPELLAVAEQDLRWERVKLVEDIGEHDCYDVCIRDEQDPNYVIEDFVVHNSWVALYCAVEAYLNGRRVYIFSKEMRREDMQRRCASMIAQVPYEKIQAASLTPEEKENYFSVLEGLGEWEDDLGKNSARKHPSLCFDSDKGRKGASNVDDLVARAEKFEPDLMLIDGLYLMKDGRTGTRTADWKNIAHISQDVKGAAQYMEIPILATTQANRANAKAPTDDMDDLSFSDSLGQDADMAIRLFKGPNPTSISKYALALTFPALREADLHPFLINAAPGHNFSLLQKHFSMAEFLESKNKLDKEEEDAAKDSDGGGGAKPKPKKKPKTPFRV